ncbi:hypothetical protein ACH5RR_032885 [Cinchona calisaya]|uniref:Uncharacterized protein n=1 Tax=Cinchona calisaya TaxID=153742 RepID=A0ABD2YKK0_9GENT
MVGSLSKKFEKEESSSSETKRGIKLRKNKKKKKKEDITKTILDQLLGEFKNLPKNLLSGIMTQTPLAQKETKNKEEKGDSSEAYSTKEDFQGPCNLEDQVSSTNGVDSIGYDNIETTL